MARRKLTKTYLDSLKQRSEQRQRSGMSNYARTSGGLFSSQGGRLRANYGDEMGTTSMEGYQGNDPNKKVRAKSYADSMLATALAHRYSEKGDGGTMADADDPEKAKRLKNIYLKFAKNNGATVAEAKQKGFSRSELAAAGFAVG